MSSFLSIALMLLASLASLAALKIDMEVVQPSSPVPTTSAILISRKLYPDHFFYHIHIPKTGGQSLFLAVYEAKDVPLYNCYIMPCCEKNLNKNDDIINWVQEMGNCSFFSYELKPAQVNKVLKYPREKFKGISFFREPMRHSISALQHFKVSAHQNSCRSANEYLSGKPCSMYNISNLQTSRMGYSDVVNTDMNVTLAIERMNSLFFVGITEHYSASICLLRYQLGQFDKNLCDCRKAQKEEGSIIPQRINSGAYNVTEARFSLDNIMKIRSMLDLDYVLFNHALMLFYARVKVVEEKFDVKLVCDDSNLAAHAHNMLRSYASTNIEI